MRHLPAIRPFRVQQNLIFIANMYYPKVIPYLLLLVILSVVSFYVYIGVIFDPRFNVKTPMVRKPVHMLKPRCASSKKKTFHSVEKRQVLKETNSPANLSNGFPGSAAFSQYGSGGESTLYIILCNTTNHYQLKVVRV